MAYTVGEAAVQVTPYFDQFHNKIKSAVEKENKQHEVKVDVEAETKDFYAESSIPEGETMRVLAALFADRHTDFNHLVSELKDQPVEVIQVLTEEMYDFWNSDVLKVPGKSKG